MGCRMQKNLVDIFYHIRQVAARSRNWSSGASGRSKGSSMATFERAMVLCDHCAISNHSAAICHQVSPTLKSKGLCHFGTKIWGGRG